jgi:uncharacterized protein (TIGR00297 family)
VRAVSTSGAIAGGLVTFLLFVTAGAGAFAGVVTVFVLTLLSTRLGYARKQILGTAERRSGRNAWQILANLGIPTGCAVLSVFAPRPEIWLIATVAALAEAAADTVSSEFGQATTEMTYLISTGERVPVGTDGAISLAGTLAGIAAAAVVAMVCAGTRVVQFSWTAPAATAGVLGMFFDSYLGALWERRHRLGNNQVNFLSTMLAAALAILFVRLL